MTVHQPDEVGQVRPLFLMGGVIEGGYLFAPHSIVRACKREQDVYDSMVALDRIRGRTHEFYAQQMGIDPSHWSRMRKGTARFSPDWRLLEALTNCRLYTQWIAFTAGFDLREHIETPEEELERLRAERKA